MQENFFVFLTIHCVMVYCQSMMEVVFNSDDQAPSSDFKILVNGSAWLEENLSLGSRVFVRSNGQTYSTTDQSLRLESPASIFNGRDVLGSFSSHLLRWSPIEIGFETQLRVYDQDDLVVFSQRFQVIEML